MSAYVVHTDTIDYLVAAAGRFGCHFYAPLPLTADPADLAAAPMRYDGNTYRLDGRTQDDLLGAILLAQNVRSVNARYQENDPMPTYQAKTIPYSQIDPIIVLKSIACLRYQSCETDDYGQTFAAAILERLQAEAIAHLPGYDAAPWGWTRPQERRVS